MVNTIPTMIPRTKRITPLSERMPTNDFCRGAKRTASSVGSRHTGSGLMAEAGCSPGRQRPVGRQGALEIVGFRARDQADLLESRQLLLGLGRLAERQIQLSEVLMRAT